MNMLIEYQRYFPNDSDDVIKLKAKRAGFCSVDMFVQSEVLYIKTNQMVQGGIISQDRWHEMILEIFAGNGSLDKSYLPGVQDNRVQRIFGKGVNYH